MYSKLTDLKGLIPASLKPITPLERRLLEGSVEGLLISGETKQAKNLENKTVRAKFLCWLIGDKDANKFIHYSGIEIENALIDGEVNLEGATISFPLVMRKCVFNKRIVMNGAQIVNLDLSGSNLQDGMIANFLRTQASILLSDDFVSDDTVSFRGAEIFGNLFCKNSQFIVSENSEPYTINATLANIRGNVYLGNSTHNNGAVYFHNANIRGVFDCEGAKISNTRSDDPKFEPEAISLEGAKIEGSILLRNGFSATGTVRLISAVVGGAVECDGGSFTTINENSILAEGLSTIGSIFLRNGFKSIGCVKLNDAIIGGNLECADATFENNHKISLTLERARISGGVLLGSGFSSIGTVILREADIDGTLECESGSFNAGEGDDAINADGVKVSGNILMRRKFKAFGCVRLYGAEVGNDVDCFGSSFENEDSIALLLDRTKIGGIIYLNDKFQAKGLVSLIGSTASILNCEDGHFNAGKNEVAINADGLTTTGPVLLRFGFSAMGCVRLYGARIGLDLDCEGASFSYNKSIRDEKISTECFVGAGMTVGGEFKWTNQNELPNGDVILTNATVKVFRTDGKSLLKEKNNNKVIFSAAKRFAPLNMRLFLEMFFEKSTVSIDGFTYNDFEYGNENASNARDVGHVKNRLVWLNLRPLNQKSLQPYTQVIKTLSISGHGNEARQIAIARERQRSKNLPLLRRIIRDVFYGWTVDYGYSPAKTLYFVLAIVLTGYFIFGTANTQGAMVPTQNRLEKQSAVQGGGRDQPHYYQYPEFVPLAYSVDVFLPIVDLHQEEYWMPSTTTIFGVKALNYMWFHIAAGWFLTTLFVSAITGIVRTDTE